ncbi:hypothetical protein NUACC21_10730 [Scytonema sp. NUACC21]
MHTFINETRKRVGLQKLNKSSLERITQPPDLYLLGTVPEFEYPRSDLYEHAHFVGPFINPPVEQFDPPSWWHDLYGERPVIFVTQGTASNNNLNDLIVTIMQALADEDMLVLYPDMFGLWRSRLGIRLFALLCVLHPTKNRYILSVKQHCRNVKNRDQIIDTKLLKIPG